MTCDAYWVEAVLQISIQQLLTLRLTEQETSYEKADR